MEPHIAVFTGADERVVELASSIKDSIQRKIALQDQLLACCFDIGALYIDNRADGDGRRLTVRLSLVGKSRQGAYRYAAARAGKVARVLQSIVPVGFSTAFAVQNLPLLVGGMAVGGDRD